jgi:hypothetical protein
LRQVRVLSACCLLPAAFLIMTSADLEHNDKLLAKEKLEWVTPKISLMEGEATAGGGPLAIGTSAHKFISSNERVSGLGGFCGPS